MSEGEIQVSVMARRLREFQLNRSCVGTSLLQTHLVEGTGQRETVSGRDVNEIICAANALW